MKMEQEAFYKICFDALIDGLCIANNEGKIVMNNAAFEDIFGLEPGEAIGQSIEILIPERHRKVHRHHFASYFEHPKKFMKGKGREFYGVHKNGEILDLEIGLNFFEFEGKRYAKALISEISSRKQIQSDILESNRRLESEVDKRTQLLTDAVSKLERTNLMLKDEVKERIKAERKARGAFKKEKELNQMQAKFLSMVAHEFKTPLSGILTSAGLIHKHNETVSNARISKHVAIIKDLVLQLNDVLDDYLFLENSQTGRYKFTSSRFMFCDLIRSVVEDSKALLKPGQRIHTTLCKTPTTVVQDRKVVDIIIRNVLYNAIKYSPADTRIDIDVEVDEMVRIHIRDQGIGIPEEAKGHIFNQFYRARNVLHIQGTGIGLNIVRRHLQRMGGSIEIRSKENEGTEVSITMPVLSSESREGNESVEQDTSVVFGTRDTI
jgi:PAS domain S-box-containing protein